MNYGDEPLQNGADELFETQFLRLPWRNAIKPQCLWATLIFA